MLPPDPPKLSSRDFDPATMADDVNMEMEVDEEESRVELSSVEINILIYLYLLESNFSHTAFTLLSESNLPSTSLFKHYNPSFPTPTAPNSKGKQANGSSGPSRQPDGFGKSEGRIERGELVRRLWKSLRWEEVERHIGANGEPFKPTCPNPFHLLIPHACPPSFPSSSNNPTLPLPPSLRVSPPPPKRPEVFPPGPEAPEAGPSRSNRSTGQAINISTTSQAETSTVDPVKGKRKSRRESDASDSREASPAVSTRAKSPVPTTKSKKRDKDKKRARISETATAIASDQEKDSEGKGRSERDKDDGDDMDVDNEPKESRRSKAKSGPNGKADSSKLSVEEKPDRRSKSPMKSTPRLKGRIPDTESEQDEPEKPSRNGRKSTSAQEKKAETPAHIISGENVATFVEHRDMVSCVAWNPQNRLNLSTGSSDGTARLWDFDEKDEGSALSLLRQTPIPHKSIESSKKGVTALAWHPDGTFFATGCQDGVGRLFTPSGSMQGIMSYGRGAISALKFSPSGSFILTAKDDFTICLWSIGNVYQRPMLRSFESHKGKVTDIDWLDDDVFASGGHDHTIFIFRTNDKRPRYTFKGHTDDVTKLKWSPTASTINKLGGASKEWEKRLLASVSDDGTCMVWKLPSYPEDRGTTSRSSSPTKMSNAGAIANGPGGSEKDDYFQGNGAVIGIDHCVNRLNVVTRSVNRRMDTLEWSPSCKDGRMILAAGGQDSTVKLFDALSGQTLYTLSGLETGTGSICFSPAAKNLVAGGGWNGKLVIWDIETGKRVKELEIEEDAGKQASREKPMMMTMQWRDDGEHLAIGMHNKSLMTVYTGELGEAGVGRK